MISFYPANPEKSCSSCLINFPFLNTFLGFKAEPLLDRPTAQYHARNILTDRRPMFKSMPRAAAHEPHILKSRMSIDQKIAVRRVLILAYTCLSNRRICESRHTPREVLTHRIQARGRHHPFTCIRIEFWSMCVNRELETP